MNPTHQHNLVPGDKIFVRTHFGLVSHYGIFIGHHSNVTNGVIHADKNLGIVTISSLQDFSDAKAVNLEWRAKDFSEQISAVDRAMALLGQKYDLINFNCEHAANYAQTGRFSSPQLGAAAILASLLLVAYLAKD